MIETPQGPWLSQGETLVCFGDSITEAHDGYVALLEEFLSSKGIHVINAGRGGDKTPWALTRLVHDVIDLQPDAVLLFFGTNDAVIGRGRWRDEPVVEPLTYRDNLVWMVHLCRLRGIRKFSIAPPLGRLEGDSWHEFGDIERDYCQMARAAADRVDALFVPLDTAMEQKREEQGASSDGRPQRLTRDGVHPNPLGCKVIADTMLKVWGLLDV